MKPIQYFSKDYMKQFKGATPTQLAQFVEDYRVLIAGRQKSRLISVRVPVPLLQSFKEKSKAEGLPYQTKIKDLMRRYLDEF